MMSAQDTTTPPLEHGGALEAARRLFPGAPEPLLDLSTGINPVPYPLPALTAEAFTRLPEQGALERLQQAAALAYGAADPAMVVAAPGTQLLISLLPRLLPQPRVAVLGPTYGEHAAAWRAAGTPVTEADEFGSLAGHQAVVLCNPNNPDGRRHPRAALAELAGRVRLLVVDEAFADLEPDDLGAASLLPCPGLLVLRSFGKTYGLAGLRLGFAMASVPMAQALRTALGPWAVSGPALLAGTQALTDRAWRNATMTRCTADAARLDAMLETAGLRVIGGTRLFRLAESPEAVAWFGRLGTQGIMVRRFREAPARLRFGLPGTVEDWWRLEAALRDR